MDSSWAATAHPWPTAIARLLIRINANKDGIADVINAGVVPGGLVRNRRCFSALPGRGYAAMAESESFADVDRHAARAWREAQADDTEVQVPEVPADVRGRLDAIWADAYRAAITAVRPERDRLAVEVEELRAEVDALTATVEDVETERDDHATCLEAAGQERDTAVSEHAAATARAERAEDRAKAAEAERDRLDQQIRALIARIPETTTKDDGR